MESTWPCTPSPAKAWNRLRKLELATLYLRPFEDLAQVVWAEEKELS